MKRDWIDKGPVVAGGIERSGAGIIADLLSLFGFYIGYDLNASKDNCWYSLLFERWKWFLENSENTQAIATGLSLFDKIMTGRSLLDKKEKKFLFRAIVRATFSGVTRTGRGRGIWPSIRFVKMIEAKKKRNKEWTGWGWKSSNSHLLIRDMAANFENFKYIHAVRHGFDLVSRGDAKGLADWAPLYGVKEDAIASKAPKAILTYWARANRRTVRAGGDLGASRFLLVDFETLHASPATEIQRLISFLGIDLDDARYEKAFSLLRTPITAAGYEEIDRTQFDEDDLSALREFGYSID